MQCIVCQQSLAPERIEALEFLGTPKNEFTCKEHSLARPLKGIYSGEYGTSQLFLARSLGTDGVDRNIEQEVSDDNSKRY
jgi:hypothetical protein